MIRRGLAAAVVAVALGVAGCGDDDEPQAVDDAVEEAAEAAAEDLPEELQVGGEDAEPSDQATGSSDDVVEGTDCPDAGSPPNITGVTVYKDLPCDEASAALDEIVAVSKEFVLDSFSCGRISGGKFSGTWECADFDGRYFRFDFAD